MASVVFCDWLNGDLFLIRKLKIIVPPMLPTIYMITKMLLLFMHSCISPIIEFHGFIVEEFNSDQAESFKFPLTLLSGMALLAPIDRHPCVFPWT